MFQNIATRFASLCPDSDTFLLTSTYYSCSVEMIKLQQPYPDDFVLDESQRSELLSRKEFDHAIHLSPPSLSDIPPVVLFSSYKKDLHTWLSALNADSIPSILLRPFHSQSTHPSEHTQLGGYGIALDIKNTEYKVVDDRSATGVRMAENEVEAELETEFQGFHFATLKSRYPDLVPSLQAFKESLQEEMSQTTGAFRIPFLTSSYTALTKLLFVVIHTTSHKGLLGMETCHNSNKELNDYTSSHGTQ